MFTIILIATPQKDMGAKLASYLCGHGYPADVALDQKEMLSKIMCFRYVIVLLDFVGLNGDKQDLVQQIKKIQPTAQVIAIDSDPKTFSVVEYLGKGADDYIVIKDFDDPGKIKRAIDAIGAADERNMRWKELAREISQIRNKRG